MDESRITTLLLPLHTFKSVARCAYRDTWDEETGKKVVDVRNKLKFHDYRLRQLDRMMSLFADVHDALESMVNNHWNEFYDARDELCKYTEEEVEYESN